MAQSAVSKLSRFVTATQEGVNGFVMMNSNSRAYRTAFMEASKLSKFGSILSTVGKVVEHPLFTPVAIGIGTLNDVLNNGKKPGQALVYNSTETLVGTATAGLTTAGITALSSTPVGWAGLAGVAAGYGAVKLFQWGYG